MNSVPCPNLLPLSRTQSRRRDSAFRLWVIALVSIVFCIVLPSGMLCMHLRSAKPVDSDHVNRFAADLHQLQNALPPLQSELSKLQVASHSKRLSEQRISWPSVLNHLSKTTGEHVRVYSFSGSVEQESSTPQIVVRFQAQTETLSQAREFLVLLEETGLYDEITMIESRKQSSASDSTVNSTIQARIYTGPTVETP